MSPKKIDHKWSKNDLDNTICEHVSEALHEAHKDIASAMKNIALVTGISEDTAGKWYRGLNPPDSAHLLMLAAYYPTVLRVILEIIGRKDLWQIAVHSGVQKHMKNTLIESNKRYNIWGDTNVTPRNIETAKKSTRFNDRQLWFLQEMIHRTRLQNKDIVSFWGVTERTAKRDTEKLLAEGMIRTVRQGSSSWYESAT